MRFSLYATCDLLAPPPIVTAAVFGALWLLTARLPFAGDRHTLVPFLGMAAIFTLGFAGLAYSWRSAATPSSLTAYLPARRRN